MPIDPSLLAVHTHNEPAFRPVVDFEGWRVAVLNYVEHLEPENLTNMQRHDETDEVFVLLKGRCILFVGDGKDTVGRIQAADMAAGTVYNVRRGVWHTHTLSRDASVLVVENRDTTTDNSPFCELTSAQTEGLVVETLRIWGERSG